MALLLTTLAAQVSAQAALKIDEGLGEKIVSIPVAGKRSAICVIPFHFEGAKYSKKDLEREQTLCSLNESHNAGVCAKTNSSNPGLNFHTLPGNMSVSQLEAAKCEANGSKKIGKYKLSTSCSYSPSILAYYHVSRILGGVAEVPVSVLRTFDLQRHIQIGQQAVKSLKSSDLIAQTWNSLLSQLRAGNQASKRNQLLTENFDQSYGALSWNPSNESFYKEFFAGGSDQISRAIGFRDRTAVASLLKNQRHVSEFIGRQFTAQNLQKMVQMKDASEMIILDTLLNQQDRFGNIHFEMESYFFDMADRNQDGTPKLKSKGNLNPDEAKQALTVKKMILKDNDCGVSKLNIASQARLPDIVKHLDPVTYSRLQQLARAVDHSQIAGMFIRGLGFTQNDYAGFSQNVKFLAAKFRQACQAGQLKLDLNLQNHFSNQPLKEVSCDI